MSRAAVDRKRATPTPPAALLADEGLAALVALAAATTDADLLAGARRLLAEVAGTSDFTILVAQANGAGHAVGLTTRDGVVGWAEPSDPALQPVRHAAPLQHRGRAAGHVLFHDVGPHADAALLDRLAAVVGAAYVRHALHASAEHELRSALARLAAVVDCGEMLSHLDLDHLLPRLLEQAIQAAGADVGAILLVDGDRLVSRIEWGIPEEWVLGLRDAHGAPLAAQVLETGQPFLASRLAESGEVLLGDAAYDVGSLLLAPLVREGRQIGVLALAQGVEGAEIGERERDVVVTLAGLAATAIENARLHTSEIESERAHAQLRVAGQIQKRLLAVAPPEHPRLEFAGWSLACDEAGGDYFDIVPLDDGRVLCVLGDVSGHGVGSALLMATARAVVRSCATTCASPARVLEAVNRVLSADVEEGLFMTMAVFVVDPAAGRAEFASAGHGPSFVLRAASRAVDELGPTGLLLGIDATESYGTEIVEGLEAGDSLLLFTDGIWEARDASGRPLGLDAFAAWVREHGAGGAAPLAEGVRGALDAFAAGAPRRDDMTFLAASLRAPAHA